MNEYKYQLHTHTAPCSACAHMSPAELCQALHEAGYQGAVLTNHFYHGNSGIDRASAWEDFVGAYEADYQACVQEAKKYDLDILFGIEEGVGSGLEVLCYGITPKVLYDNPQLRDCPLEEFWRVMRENGVMLIQAHPFRETPYIPQTGVLPLERIDGIEVYNRANRTGRMDEKAVEVASSHPCLIQTAGGDSHRPHEVAFGGIQTTRRLKTIEDLVSCLRQKDYRLITHPRNEE